MQLRVAPLTVESKIIQKSNDNIFNNKYHNLNRINYRLSIFIGHFRVGRNRRSDYQYNRPGILHILGFNAIHKMVKSCSRKDVRYIAIIYHVNKGALDETRR